MFDNFHLEVADDFQHDPLELQFCTILLARALDKTLRPSGRKCLIVSVLSRLL